MGGVKLRQLYNILTYENLRKRLLSAKFSLLLSLLSEFVGEADGKEFLEL